MPAFAVNVYGGGGGAAGASAASAGSAVKLVRVMAKASFFILNSMW